MTRQPQRPRRGSGGFALTGALTALVTALAIAGGAAVGMLVVDRLAADRPAASTSPTPSATVGGPVADVRGRDLANLPRYPDAVRTAYLHERQGSTEVTAVEYIAADAELDDVRAFYRRIFRERGWELIELDFSGGEWIFLVERKGRAALVEIEEHGRRIVVEIEVERAIAGGTPPGAGTPEPQPPPAQPPPPPPPPGDDDDDDGGGGDD